MARCADCRCKRDDNRKPSRVPGAYVVTIDAEPSLYVERGGKGLAYVAALGAFRGGPTSM